MDDFETASLEGGPVPLYPLYSVNPQPNSRTDNLSCSKNDQFCYLCQYTQETGLATDIRDHIRVLAGSVRASAYCCCRLSDLQERASSAHRPRHPE